MEKKEETEKDRTLDTMAKVIFMIFICIGVAFGIKAVAISMLVFYGSGLLCMILNRIYPQSRTYWMPTQ